MAEAWKNCGACKKPIPYGGTWWACSVSTCNRSRFALAFCSLPCWDSHVAVLNHRNAWAEERKAPAAPDTVDSDRPTRRRVPTTAVQAEEHDVLIVASKLKKYIKDRADMNMAADVLDALSDMVRYSADDAMERAREDGRKTVKARDFK